MSTRSIIVVTGKPKHGQDYTVRLYKHSDGYPTGNLPLIAEALTLAENKIRENAHTTEDLKEQPHAELIGQCIVAASLSVYGFGAHIDDEWVSDNRPGKRSEWSETFDPKKHLGNQGDLEWLYLVNQAEKSVSVFASQFGEDAQTSFSKGPTDPLTYIKKLYPEFQEVEASHIQVAIYRIEAFGYQFNPASKVIQFPKRKRGAK